MAFSKAASTKKSTKKKLVNNPIVSNENLTKFYEILNMGRSENLPIEQLRSILETVGLTATCKIFAKFNKKQISKKEFATLLKSNLSTFSEEFLNVGFESIDKKNSGSITLEELQNAVASDSVDLTILPNLISEVDQDGTNYMLSCVSTQLTTILGKGILTVNDLKIFSQKF